MLTIAASDSLANLFGTPFAGDAPLIAPPFVYAEAVTPAFKVKGAVEKDDFYPHSPYSRVLTARQPAISMQPCRTATLSVRIILLAAHDSGKPLLSDRAFVEG